MGVYIKGMEIPIACYECRMYEADIYYCAAAERDIDIPSSDEGRCSFCPLVPVPPHGRMGDLNALCVKFSRLESEAMNALKTTTTGSVNWIKWSAILTERTGYKHDIAAAPTIIPAEEGE